MIDLLCSVGKVHRGNLDNKLQFEQCPEQLQPVVRFEKTCVLFQSVF